MCLVFFRDVLESEHTIHSRKWRDTESVQYRLQIGSKEMCEDLESLGVSQKKAHTMRLPKVPKRYFGSFVRGYFDGDGNVWVGQIHKNREKKNTTIQTAFTSCSKPFLLSLQSRLIVSGLGQGSLSCKMKAFCLKYSVNDSLKLYNLMYSETCSGLYLNRKKRIFEKFIKMRR